MSANMESEFLDAIDKFEKQHGYFPEKVVAGKSYEIIFDYSDNYFYRGSKINIEIDDSIDNSLILVGPNPN
jgi:hypothetical protein